MARLIGLLAVVFGFLLGGTSVSVAAPSTDAAAVVYTYTAPVYDAPETYAALERGPPATTNDYAAPRNDTVDLRSPGESARPGESLTPTLTTYTHAATLVPVASATTTTGAQVGLTDGALSSFQRLQVAANGGDEGIDLYRHVSPGELADIGENGFRSGAGSLDGKWFAESAEHASEWGRVLNGGTGSVVKVRVPNSFGNQLMRLEKLDGIGPARYVEPHQLAELNRYGRKVWR